MELNSMLIGGGLLSGAAVMWSHAKNIYKQVSGLLLIRAEVDEYLGDVVIIPYLFREWKRPPKIESRYASLWSRVVGYVPYRVYPVKGLNYKGFKFVYISMKDFGVHMTSLRGFCDLEKLIKEATLSENTRCLDAQNQNKKEGRFRVLDVIGEEVGKFDWKKKGGEDPQGDDIHVAQAKSYIQNTNSLSLTLHGSFVYARNVYEESFEDPYEGLYLEDNVLNVIEQTREWQNLRQWYFDRKIPWRRGLLLYGPGGSGKSSLVKAIAKDLEYPLYRFYLSTLSDQEFLKFWKQLSAPCVVLFEDLDSVFHGRESVSKNKNLSFDCVLNAISGVDSKDGIFLVITTNEIDKIDPAIGISSDKSTISSRPGRVDTVVKMDYMSEQNRRKMATVTLRDWPEYIEEAVHKGSGYTGAQFQELLIQTAFEIIKKQNGKIDNMVEGLL